MSIFNDKSLKSVADIAAQIMEASRKEENKFHNKLDKLMHSTFGASPDEKKMKKEETELSSKQKAIAKLDHPKDKIDSGDLAKLRAGHKPVKEEKEEKHEDEAEDKKLCTGIAKKEVKKHEKEMHKEETEQLQEYQSTGGVYKHKGTYGTEKGAEHGSTEWDKEEKMAKKLGKPVSRKLGARQNNFVRGLSDGTKKNIKESFTEMLSAYTENGLKSIVKEEPDNEEFTKELEDQKASMEGKKKQPSVAAPATQGVKTMPEEYEVIDANEINGVTIDTIEERTLTEPETKKKEEVVKSMKKNLSGFKERYGQKGKQVLYATATKIAKEKA